MTLVLKYGDRVRLISDEVTIEDRSPMKDDVVLVKSPFSLSHFFVKRSAIVEVLPPKIKEGDRVWWTVNGKATVIVVDGDMAGVKTDSGTYGWMPYFMLVRVPEGE